MSLSVVKKYPGEIILILFLAAGLLSFRAYGISWDEEAQREAAKVSWKYISGEDRMLLEWPNRDYGVVFEMLLYGIEKTLGMQRLDTIYYMRHLVTHLFFLFSALLFYRLLLRSFQSRVLAVTGLLLYLLHPRIYADSFYNSKDLPFLSLFSICMYAFFRAFEGKRMLSFVCLGVLSGLLIDIRVLGLIVPALVLFFLCIAAISRQNPPKKYLGLSLVYLCSSTLAMYAFWPTLWEHPIDSFQNIWKNMSVFVRWDASVLYNGRFISGKQLPPQYLSVWFLISTPIFTLLCGLAGLIAVSIRASIRPLQFPSKDADRLALFSLFAFVGPLLAVILFHSVVYDAWRQVFFIYPAFVVLAVWALHRLYCSIPGYQSALNLILPAAAAGSLIPIVRHFPVENVYFNSLAGSAPEEIRHRWEMDYWGLSFRGALQYILDHDSSAHIVVRYREYPCALTANFLFTNHARLGLMHVDETVDAGAIDSGDYFITNYRLFPYEFESCKGREIYSLIMNNSRVCTIFKLK